MQRLCRKDRQYVLHLTNSDEFQGLVYVNGFFVKDSEAQISSLDRGFTLGDGIFETMVASKSKVSNFDKHMDRLKHGAGILHIEIPPLELIGEILSESIRRNGFDYSVIRLTLTRGTDFLRGLEVHPNLEPSIVVRTTPWGGPLGAISGGVKLISSPILRNNFSPLSGVKSLGYTEAVLARHESKLSGADDALICNVNHKITGGSSSNIFLVMGGKLVTPPISDGILPGIARSGILSLASKLSIPVLEESITKIHLEYCQEVFLSNVVTGIVPVISIDGVTIESGSAGIMTDKLFETYWESVRADLS